ncbi:MAG: Methionine aminopeptidase [Candidatus Moranbacteria bacterium GW2011_GWC2_37_8]|nr:MAG: Methionine aminopeptidase [Candidatus Moranbacteria bacterium GW2011_GWC2_37_8]KKQ62768.1 MAG: methionine aminopeptidase, methionyl aminopeptidase [Parcubacteria group bacterium GW2011_GWC1_38_22]
MSIHIKSEAELEIMRRAGKALSQVMRDLEVAIQPGASTMQIDKLAEELVLAHGALPAFKGYGEKRNPFPATICASINDEVVHGIPSEDVILKDGDIFKIDIGLKLDGYFADMARTFAIGEISPEAQKLIEATEKSFWKGVKNLKEGGNLSEFSKAAQQTAEDAGFSVVKNLVGHGIGKNLHENPQVPNYFEKGYRDMLLKAGMTLALEPMVNQGTHETVIGPDGWVYLTADRKLSAHYENTILITKDGVEILTQ